MKKLFCIVLIFLFLFHGVGYYLVFLGLRYHSDQEMNQRLESEDYADDETLTFKIPLSAPYFPNTQGYEPINGAFENHGEFFKLVKQRLERDTLYVVCIKDQKETRLFKVMADFVKLSNDLPVSQQTLKLLSGFTKDFIPTSAIHAKPNPCVCLASNFTPPRVRLLATVLPVFSPPPDPLI